MRTLWFALLPLFGCHQDVHTSNEAPEIAFVSPEADAELSGESLTLIVQIEDFETPAYDLDLAFASDQDGRLEGELVRNGQEVSLTIPPLSIAYHELSATVLDPDGGDKTALVTIAWLGDGSDTDEQ